MAKEELLRQYGFVPEVYEVAKNQFIKSEYPAPIERYRLIYETYAASIEEAYFWVLKFIRQDMGFHFVEKIIDTFAAAENSAFFGVSQAKIGAQQEKVSTFLAAIGKMVKDLFQLVRELRILDERLGYYEQSLKGVESAEIVLKGIWIDMVEGGAKNPASVYGMAREVQFVSLPDLFFSTHPKTEAEVDKVVDTQRAQFNKAVRNVLKRKLKSFLMWKEKTYKELKTRRLFTLKYLKQHYEIIRMYMTWIKPYLRHIRRLTLDEDKTLTPDLIAAFEGSMVEIEFLASKLPLNPETGKQNKDMYAVVLAHFLYRTRPQLAYQQERYQAPIHIGKLELNLRGYVWTKEQIEQYKKLRSSEDFELLRSISDSVKSAMDALGDELKSYLKEAEGVPKIEAGPALTKPKEPSFFERLRAEFFGPRKVKKETLKPRVGRLVQERLAAEKKLAAKETKGALYNTFEKFKKAHNMISW